MKIYYRLKFLLICRAKLLFINGEVDQHRKWLDENSDVSCITKCDVTNPIQLDQAVQEIKVLFNNTDYFKIKLFFFNR